MKKEELHIPKEQPFITPEGDVWVYQGQNHVNYEHMYQITWLEDDETEVYEYDQFKRLFERSAMCHKKGSINMDTGILEINDIAPQAYTNDDGLLVYNEIKKAWDYCNSITISFDNIPNVSSSFINSAFIELLNSYTYDQIKEKIKFTHSNKSINQAIRRQFKIETENK